MDYRNGILQPGPGLSSRILDMGDKERYVVFKALNRRIRRNFRQSREYNTRQEKEDSARETAIDILKFNPYGAL